MTGFMALPSGAAKSVVRPSATQIVYCVGQHRF
jgi:hypothetical protein